LGDLGNCCRGHSWRDILDLLLLWQLGCQPRLHCAKRRWLWWGSAIHGMRPRLRPRWSCTLLSIPLFCLRSKLGQPQLHGLWPRSRETGSLWLGIFHAGCHCSGTLLHTAVVLCPGTAIADLLLLQLSKRLVALHFAW